MLFYSVFAIIFVFLLNFFNFGTFSYILLLSYLFGYHITFYHFKKLVVIFEKAWYNKITKWFSNSFLKPTKRKTKERNIENEISSKS